MITKIINNLGQEIDDDDLFEVESELGHCIAKNANNNSFGKNGGYFVVAVTKKKNAKKYEKYICSIIDQPDQTDDEIFVVLGWYKTKKRAFEVDNNLMGGINFERLRDFMSFNTSYYRMPAE